MTDPSVWRACNVLEEVLAVVWRVWHFGGRLECFGGWRAVAVFLRGVVRGILEKRLQRFGRVLGGS